MMARSSATRCPLWAKAGFAAVAAAALALFAAALAGCAKESAQAAGVRDLMENVQAAQAETESQGLVWPVLSEDESAAMTSFSVRLLQQDLGVAGANEPGNVLVSPASVLFALGLTANGAQGETLAQMEDVCGMSLDQMNAALAAWGTSLDPQEQAAQDNPKATKVNLANSIWLREDEKLSVNPAFLQTNADVYRAGAFAAPFDDATCDAINAWVSENTNGMIDKLVDSIPPDAMLYLVNALSFEAQWTDQYEEGQVEEGVFTTEGGTRQDVRMMVSTEETYLESASGARGFMKPYQDGYAFAGILPPEGMGVREYVASLDGESFAALMNGAQFAEVDAKMPKFSAEYETNLANSLAAMGMPAAFDGRAADFSAMGTYEDANLAIGRVLHKAYIDVDENGTKAAAATAVEMMALSALPPEQLHREVVHLDRPFVYAIMDLNANAPLFIGVIESMA